MSRLDQCEYEYPPNPEDKYYIDEHEGFAADYSDSDCLPDSSRQNHLRTVPAPPHISELYGRHSQLVPVKVIPLKKTTNMVSKQQSEQFIQQSYYDRSIINQSTTVAPPLPCYPTVYETPRNFYPLSAASQHDTNYGTKAFRSAYHNVEQFRQFNCQNCQMSYQKPPISKRFPVTVRTPKYYKKQTANAVFKRPSALCLPVSAQPDPAVIRRPKRLTVNDNIYGGMSETQEMQSVPVTHSAAVLKQVYNQDMPHRVDSQGDNTSLRSAKLPPFDEILEQMEKGNMKTAKETKTSDITRITKYFKPRIPVSIKSKQDKAKAKVAATIKKTNVDKSKSQKVNEEHIDAAKATQVSLEKLLNQLKKCELAAGKGEGNVEENKNEQMKIQTEKRDNKINHYGERSDVTDDEKYVSPSFNYQDISNNLYKSQIDFKCNAESVTSIQDITKKLAFTAPRSKQYLPKRPLDDHCALELHKSKSYIVNLIDRALSKELGTIPGDRHRNEFETMNPKKAIETVSRHLGKPEKTERELSMEITSALTESLISNATSHDMDESVEENSSKNKICNCHSDEPIYIKQLKQLRWGHLRHIQREVKRLEDLERFLDSCSITTIPEI